MDQMLSADKKPFQCSTKCFTKIRKQMSTILPNVLIVVKIWQSFKSLTGISHCQITSLKRYLTSTKPDIDDKRCFKKVLHIPQIRIVDRNIQGSLTLET